MMKMAVFKTTNGKGKYHDLNSKKEVIDYILDDKKVINGYFNMMYVNPANPDLSMQDTAASFGKENGVQLRHFVVSFDRSEVSSPVVANQIAYEFMCYIAQRYQVVYAVHEDAEQLHFHIVFNSVSYVTGQRYRGTKWEHYGLLKELKIIAMKHGIYYVRPVYD